MIVPAHRTAARPSNARALDRLRSMSIAWLLCGVVAANALAQAAPGPASQAALGEPRQVLMLQPSGALVLGHGTLRNGRLVLSVAEDFRDFVLLLVDDEGAIERMIGHRTPTGQLVLRDAVGASASLQDFFAARGIELVLRVTRHRDTVQDGARGSTPAAGGDREDDDDQSDTDADDDDQADTDADDTDSNDTDADDTDADDTEADDDGQDEGRGVAGAEDTDDADSGAEGDESYGDGTP